MSAKPIVLVDGSSYLFRAYHALPPLTNSSGHPTGATYGVINMIRKLIKDYQPEHIGIVFDPKGKTFRHGMYKEYKANRPPMPDELQVQIKPIFAIIKAMGLPLIIVDGYEADDVIGTLAKINERHGHDTVISTGDKDLAQLVNKQTTLINTMTNKVMDIPGVKEKFGVTPEQIIDYLALIGDTSDNIPGIPKVGPKTAVKWLDLYQDLKGVVAHKDEIKGKVGEYLRDNLDQLKLSEELVTIMHDLKLDFTPDDLKQTTADENKLHELYSEYEFNNWLKEVSGEAKPEKIKSNYECILDEKTFNDWLDKLKAAKAFAFDTETTSLNAMQAELVGVSFAVKAGEAAYVPVAHKYEDAPKQLDRDWVLAQLKPLLEDETKTIIGQNLKYDYKVLSLYDIYVAAKPLDTMLEAYVLNSSGNQFGMDSMAKNFLNVETIHYEDVAGKGAKQIGFEAVAIEVATPYAAEDADITLQLNDVILPQVEAHKELKSVLHDIELPLMPVLAHMEERGVLIDADILKQQGSSVNSRLKTLQEKIHELAGEEFNIDSPKQMREILFEKLKLPVIKKTPGGDPSTAEPVLQALALDYPLPKEILEYRSLMKLKTTYIDKLPNEINPNTGRVHTSYRQAGTSTGRLASVEPNLQNIPIRSKEGRKIREAFVADKGCQILAADYSQVELRIMAELCGDEGLIKAFNDGLDIHSATASEVFATKLEDVTSDQRRNAKAINFGLIYGMSAYGLSQQLGIKKHVAEEYIDIYFARYPGMRDYMEEARKTARKQGYVETIFGRRLFVPEIHSNNVMRRNAAERAAINAPMQGTAADIIKKAMINIHAWLQQSKVEASMIMQVHDELVFEVEKSCLAEVKAEVKKLMENVVKMKVPLIVDIGVGDNWDEAH